MVRENVLIVGGGRTGEEASSLLESVGYRVSLIELSPKRCEELSEKSQNVTLFCGDSRLPSVLENAGVKTTDIFFALTNDDEANALCAILAKSYGVKQIFVRLRDEALMETCLKLGIENIINVPKIVAGIISMKLEGVDPLSVFTMLAGHVSIKVKSSKSLGGRIVKDIDMPHERRVLAIIRHGHLHHRKVIVPSEDEEIKENDEILFIQKRS
ncbi:MAG: TrkA family potassium uptake protein [Candidatus Wukongarchaeota archaeon]|nr:NAD-binding protein [Candidatus Wukongarchaeota archaeon]MDO8129119.1 NAD-binding protein [Candidatus Wukongarchaeota archaeon]